MCEPRITELFLFWVVYCKCDYARTDKWGGVKEKGMGRGQKEVGRGVWINLIKI